MLNGRNSLYDMSIEITVVVLREIDEIGWARIAYSHIYARKFVKTNIMIPHCTYYGHQIAQSSSQSTVHS